MQRRRHLWFQPDPPRWNLRLKPLVHAVVLQGSNNGKLFYQSLCSELVVHKPIDRPIKGDRYSGTRCPKCIKKEKTLGNHH